MTQTFPFEPPGSPFSVGFEGGFRVDTAPTCSPEDAPRRKKLRKKLASHVRRISALQRQLYAHDRYALLLVFQAMDAAGKDSTIRAVTSGVNPAGCQVFSFKAPSSEELEHDWLWRTTRRLPERGRIGIFNRSHYEEVLAVRVRPEYLAGQDLPERRLAAKAASKSRAGTARQAGPGANPAAKHSADADANFWIERFESIRDHERHLARNGTVVLKFWLNVSKEEQKRRFLRRLTREDKYWKFSASDLAERERWDDYMIAYEDLLNETSRAHAPWYAIPADDKPYMRERVASIVADTLEALPLSWPRKSDDDLSRFKQHIATLNGETLGN